MEEHIGSIIEHAIRRQGINISGLSREMNVSRRTLYNWFECAALDKRLVATVGKIIGYDFTAELGADFDSNNHQVDELKNLSTLFSEAKLSENNEAHYWMQKCIRLLEEYNQLVERVKT